MKTIDLIINGKTFAARRGGTVAAAVLDATGGAFRRSVSGGGRAPLCGMGVCFECRLTIDGVRHRRSCQITAEEGMRVETDE